MSTFGSKLRQVRVDRDLSMAAVAGACGISVPYLSDIERDRRAVPPWLDTLLGAVGASPEDAAELRGLAGVCPTCGRAGSKAS